MKSILKFTAIALLFGVSLSASAKSWNAEMSEMAKSLSAILPLIFDGQKFEDPANAELLKKEIKNLLTISKSVKDKTQTHGGGKQIGDDPALEYMASQFEGQLEVADESIRAGDPRFARLALRPALSYCISCHTRSSQGPTFPVSPFKQSLESLSSNDKMAIFVATRQYEPALKEFEKTLSSSRGDVHKLESAVRMALAVSVRAKQSPQDALRVLDLVQSSPDLPKSTERLLKPWRASVVSWMAENEKNKATPTLKTAEDLIVKAEASKTYFADSIGDIEYLRATAILHELVRTMKASETRAQAYYALGKCYDALRDLGFWDLQDMYYESCIKDAPHTPLAVRCYGKLDESVTMGYTGSSGTHLPALVSKRLSVLREFAYPKK